MQYTRLSETVTVKKVSEKGNVGVFEVQGLYTGYGTTVGNALRRALLSSLPGAAITQVKIKGVPHEFSTIPGVLEDVVKITLNLKKIKFHFFADEPQVLTLKAKGEKEVKSGDIAKTANVKVVDPNLRVATLTKKSAELDVELTVEKGLGYIPSESRKLERLPVGTIILDAVFSPVIRVAYSVENMRVGERTDYNRLVIEIETDGSIAPGDALRKSANVLRDHFDKFSGIGSPSPEPEVQKETKERKKEAKAKKETKKKSETTK